MIGEVVEAFRAFPAGGHLLDAGCGTGNFLGRLARQLPLSHAIGYDFSFAMLKRAEKKVRDMDGVRLVQGNLNRRLPFADECFDGVASVNVLYILENPRFALAELRRVLKTGGLCVIATPPRDPRMTPIFGEHIALLKKRHPRTWPFLLVGHLLLLLPFMFLFILINQFIKEKQDHHFFKREDILSLLKEAGFNVEQIKKTYAGQDWLITCKKQAG